MAAQSVSAETQAEEPKNHTAPNSSCEDSSANLN